ncbi:hypothetical protein D3C86_1953890 [compost metagenome]
MGQCRRAWSGGVADVLEAGVQLLGRIEVGQAEIAAFRAIDGDDVARRPFDAIAPGFGLAADQHGTGPAIGVAGTVCQGRE